MIAVARGNKQGTMRDQAGNAMSGNCSRRMAMSLSRWKSARLLADRRQHAADVGHVVQQFGRDAQ